MKKLFKALCACILAGTLCFGSLFGCSDASNNGINQVLNFDRAFYYTAIGGINLFNAKLETEDSILSGNSGVQPYSESEILSEQEEKKLVANSVIAAGTIGREVLPIEEKDSDNDLYALTRKVLVTQSGSPTVEYNFYYDKTSYKLDDSGDIKLLGIVTVSINSELIGTYIIEAKKQIEFGEVDIDVFLYAPDTDDDGEIELGTDGKPKRSNTKIEIEQKFEFGKQAFRYTYDFEGERIVETTALYEKTGSEIIPFFYSNSLGKTVYYNFSFAETSDAIVATALIRENDEVTKDVFAAVTIDQTGYLITYPETEN